MPDFNWDGIDDRILLTPAGCWQWQGATNGRGYGMVTGLGTKTSFYTHRVMYEKLVGPIPSGFQIDHLCRNTLCCNPDHLEPVTPKENTRRGLGKGKETHCPSGHPYDEVNTYAYGGRRYCRTCTKAHVQAHRARKRTERAEAAA